MKEDGSVINSIKKNNYLKAGSLYLLGNVFNKGMVFLTIPIFTRILTTHEYGLVNTYTSWVTLFISLLGLSLHMGVMIGFSEYESKIDDYMATITTITLLNSLFWSVSLMLIFYMLNITFGMSLFLVGIALIHAGANAILKNYDMYLKFQFQYVKKSALEILPNILTLATSIFIIVYVVNNQQHLGKIIPYLIFTIMFSLFVLSSIYKKSKVFNQTYAKVALKVSIPFIFHGLSMTVLNQSDRIMITSIAGASETGIYSLIYNLSMAVTVIFMSLDNVWLPWFTKKLKQQDIGTINEKASVYFLLMSLPIVGLILLTPELLKLVAPAQYWSADISAPLIILGSYTMFIYSLYVKVEYFHKKTKSVAVNTFLAALVNISLNYFAIRLFGFHGAAATTFISYLLLLCLHYRGARKLEKNLLPIRLIVWPFLFILVNTVAYYIFLTHPLIRWLLLVLQLLATGLIKHQEILNFLNRTDA